MFSVLKRRTRTLKPRTRTNKTPSIFRNPFRTKKNPVTYIADSKNVQQANTEQEEAEKIKEEEVKVAAEMKDIMEKHNQISELISGIGSRTKPDTTDDELLAELERIVQVLGGTRKRRKNKKHKKHKKKLLSFKRSHIKY